MKRVEFELNGETVVDTVADNLLLVDYLRRFAGLTGTKHACDIGVCGVCTVLVDELPASACLTLTASLQGRCVTTIEGIGSDGLSQLQKSFIEHGAFQCGICTPGQIVCATALLKHNRCPSELEIKEWMKGNLCRCTGYYKILAAIMSACGGDR